MPEVPSRYGNGQDTSPGIAHVERALARYRRDLGLMTGNLAPVTSDPDDLAILEHLAASNDPKRLIGDRKLRIKTLEATLALLKEDITEAGNLKLDAGH